MMEVPVEVLNKLLCENCDGHLSCGPVQLKINGKSLCGRCPASEDETYVHNTPYEELARLLKFPCKYKEHGCPEDLLFSKTLKHEDACDYRPYICPLVASGKCEWIGRRVELLAHCQRDHQDRVLQNPCKLVHDILQSSLETFLMAAFNVLFLVQTKVCLVTKTIYHSVRFIGDPSVASKYNFTLDIEREGCKVSKYRQVAPQGCLFLQVDTSLATGINNLLGMLGGFQDATITLTVMTTQEEKVYQAVVEKPMVTSKLRDTAPKNSIKSWRSLTTNDKAEEPFKQPIIRKMQCTDEEEEEIFDSIRVCCMYKTKGCTYSDTNVNKMAKHQRYLCPYSSCCRLCNSDIVRGPIFAHYSEMHKSDTYETGSKWPATVNNRTMLCVINSCFGNVFCEYWLTSTTFNLFVYTSLSRKELDTYQCILQISNPRTGSKIIRSAQMMHNTIHDWYVLISFDELITYIYNSKYIMQIDFIKN